MAISMPTGTFTGTVSPAPGNATASISNTVPSGAIAGDVLVICAATAYSEIPAVRFNNATTGLTVFRSEASTNISAVFAWKRLSAADLTGTVSVTNSALRRQSLSLLIVRGAADPTFVNQPFDGASTGVATTTGPAWTPSADNALMLGLWALARPVSPYTGYSFSTSAFERTEATSQYTGNINATTYTSSRLLSTSTAGISQAGETVTATSAPFDAMGSAIVFTPQVAVGNPQPNISTRQPMAVIDCTASVAANGGVLSFSISPSVGVIEHTEGYFAVPQTTVPQLYNITITEAGGGSTTSPVTVPALPSGGTSSGSGTGVEIVRWHSGAWV